MLKDEANIHILAKKAYDIEDYTDVPSFNYLFYRNEEKREMVLAQKAIAANQPTSMKSLDNFFYTYSAKSGSPEPSTQKARTTNPICLDHDINLTGPSWCSVWYSFCVYCR